MELNKKTCKWKLVTEEDEGIYETSCEEMYCFSAGGIIKNNHKFCPFCGKKVEEVKDGKNKTDEEYTLTVAISLRNSNGKLIMSGGEVEIFSGGDESVLTAYYKTEGSILKNNYKISISVI